MSDHMPDFGDVDAGSASDHAAQVPDAEHTHGVDHPVEPGMADHAPEFAAMPHLTPDEQLAYAFVAGDLPESEQAAVERRIQEDPDFAYLVTPLLDVMGPHLLARAVTPRRTSPESFERYLSRTGRTIHRTPDGPTPRTGGFWHRPRAPMTVLLVIWVIWSLMEFFLPKLFG